MYEVRIDGSVFDVVDLYEVNTILTKKTIEKSEYLEKLKEEIFKLYYEVFQKLDSENKIKNIIKYQFLIDIAYDYLLSGKSEFEKYFDRQGVKMSDIDRTYKKLQNEQRTEKKICFNPEEIKKYQTIVETDNISFFYFFAFTVFYLDNYLLHQFAMFPEIFKKRGFDEDQIKQVHMNLIRIFSEDFAEGFKLFEEEVLSNYVS